MTGAYYILDKTKNYIPLRMASTGSNLDAEMAGRIPEIRPITAANDVPRRILPSPRTNSNSSALVKTMVMSHTKNRPITPPITQRITDSNKNWKRINLFLAPSDF